MQCRHCGADTAPILQSCRACDVRTEPVKVDPRATPPCPNHPFITAGPPPLIIMRYPPAQSSNELLHLFETLLAWWPSVEGQVAWFLDYRAVERFEDWARRIEHFGQFATKVAPLAEGKTICHAVVARDEIALAALRTLFWRDKLKFPRRFFCDANEANHWIRKQYVHVPASP